MLATTMRLTAVAAAPSAQRRQLFRREQSEAPSAVR
jgi:hypothetical protein